MLIDGEGFEASVAEIENFPVHSMGLPRSQKIKPRSIGKTIICIRWHSVALREF
jgi:hypothetical protein